MDKEPRAIVAPGSTTLHISAGVDASTGFRREALCGFRREDLRAVGIVKDLTDHAHDQLCGKCVKSWANQKEG